MRSFSGTERDTANFVYRNVDCSLYSRQDAKTESERLRAAMEAMRA